MTRLIRSIAALGLAAAATLALAQPAVADDPQPIYAAGDWQVRDWPGTYPDIEPTTAAQSTADCDTVTLTKTKGDIGTSDENTNLALAVKGGDVLQVDYTMDSTDDAAAGAVRMFAYDSADADTLNAAPTFGPAIADQSGVSGTLEIPFATDITIGTFGLTYDASNATAGTVTFTNLRLLSDDVATPIAFCKPAPPTTETTTTTAAAETTSTTTSAAPTLPVTGSSLTTLLIVAVTVIVLGVIGLVIAGAARRRHG